MQTMKLYSSTTSPYARKVMICVRELFLLDAVECVSTKVTPVAPNLEYAKHNPLMKLPALERPDGMHLFDSLVICEYLDSLAGPRLFPPAGDARWNALRLHALADGMLDAALLARYETNLRPESLQSRAWVDGQFAKVDAALDAIEREAPSWQEHFTIGQVAVVCALGFLDFRMAERPWRSTRPNLTQWAERVSHRDSVGNTVPQ